MVWSVEITRPDMLVIGSNMKAGFYWVRDTILEDYSQLVAQTHWIFASH